MDNQSLTSGQLCAPCTVGSELRVFVQDSLVFSFTETRILTLALNEHPSRSVLLIYLGIDDVPRKIFSFKYLRRLDFAL